jgi:hypothetical protein
MGHVAHESAGKLIFLAIFLLVVGGGFLAWGLASRRKGNAAGAAARHWPMAPGVITAAEVASGRVEGTAIVTGQIQDRGRFYYEPAVRYRYNVGPDQYEGTRLRFGWLTCQTQAAAERILAAYPVGRQLPVRFDPNDPSSSVLEVEPANSNALVAIVCGAGALAFGLLMLVLAMKGAR